MATMKTIDERRAALTTWEEAGVIRDVEIVSPGDGSRRFSFTIVSSGESRSIKTGFLDAFIDGLTAAWSAPRPAKRRSTKTSAKETEAPAEESAPAEPET